MKLGIYISLLVLLIVVSACTNNSANENNTITGEAVANISSNVVPLREYVCSDGIIVNDSSQCQVNKEKKAEDVAQELSMAVSRGEFDKVWDLIDSNFKEGYSEEVFVSNMEETFSDFTMVYNRVVLNSNEDVAYVYYTGSNLVGETSLPALELNWINGGWYFNAFGNMFEEQPNESESNTETVSDELEDLPELRIEYLNCYEDDYGNVRVEGKIYNKDLGKGRTARDVTVYVDFIKRDKITDTDWGYPDKINIKAGEHINFDIWVDDGPSSWDECEATLDYH